MPLTFNLRHIDKKDLNLSGVLPAEDLELDIHDDVSRVAGLLSYDLVVQLMEGAALVQGKLSLPMEFTCVRCLKQFERPLILDGWVCHLPLVGDDAEPVVNDLVNLTPHVREDILLTLPQHPLCDPECVGLKLPQREAPSRTPEKAPSAWDELDKLKLNN